MARYTGPKHKLARREGVNVLDKTSASLSRRLNILPGQASGRSNYRKASEYKEQLREKQKAKAMYGLLEKQFRSLVKELSLKKGDTGELLISLLETRLDNIIYRLFAKSRFQARQFVSHGHVLVNGKKITIPSFRVKENDIVGLSKKIETNPILEKQLEEKTPPPSFLEIKASLGKLLRMPKRSDIQVPFDTQLIIEYYSR
ncbi:30S ribosomal protein S4 [Patescibacteria group bacterium]|nr:30S ribosomal protein S4 [Patescibacteria group bacterium]